MQLKTVPSWRHRQKIRLRKPYNHEQDQKSTVQLVRSRYVTEASLNHILTNGWSFVGSGQAKRPWSPCKLEALHLFRWSTHTPSRRRVETWGPDNEMKMKRKGNEDEMKMTMRWNLLNQNAKRGTQKKREGENTNTWNLAQNGQPWKGKGKEKRRPTENGTRPAEEGEDRSAWTNLTRRKPTTT